MACDGTRAFLLGGWPKGAQADEISLIHVLDTSMYALLPFDLDSLQNREHRTHQVP
jgi:hypothetical protein